MFFCLISRCSTFLQPGFPTVFWAEVVPRWLVDGHQSCFFFFSIPLPREFPWGCARGKCREYEGYPRYPNTKMNRQPTGAREVSLINYPLTVRSAEVGWYFAKTLMDERLLPIYSAIYCRMALETCWIMLVYLISHHLSATEIPCTASNRRILPTRNSPSFLNLLHLRCGQ